MPSRCGGSSAPNEPHGRHAHPLPVAAVVPNALQKARCGRRARVPRDGLSFVAVERDRTGRRPGSATRSPRLDPTGDGDVLEEAPPALGAGPRPTRCRAAPAGDRHDPAGSRAGNGGARGNRSAADEGPRRGDRSAAAARCGGGPGGPRRLLGCRGAGHGRRARRPPRRQARRAGPGSMGPSPQPRRLARPDRGSRPPRRPALARHRGPRHRPRAARRGATRQARRRP